MNRSIASTDFKLTSKCTSDDGSLKIQLNSFGGILLEFHIKYAIYIVLFRSFYFQSIFKQPKHVVNGCNRCEGVYFCWKMEKFIQIACSNSIRKYIPHPHPLSSTIYGLSVENIGVSIFDEISTFASLSNLLLWRPAREIDFKKKHKNNYTLNDYKQVIKEWAFPLVDSYQSWCCLQSTFNSTHKIR